jgi:hypothetical protein
MHALRLLIAAFLVLMNHAVNAELITASFGGTVTLIIDQGSILHPSVQLGSRVSGAFTFESTAQGAPVTDGRTYLAGSNFGPVYFWMSTEVYSFHSPSLQIDVANNALPHQNPFGPREDRYRVGCWSGIQSISGLNVEHMALEFSITDTATLADTSLPLSASSLAGFDQGTRSLVIFGNFQGHHWQISAAVDTLTMPAPPPALSIEYVQSWPVVILAWPISATGFYLEESSGFNNHPWTRVSQPPVIILSEYKVAVEPTNGAKFYRLRR